MDGRRIAVLIGGALVAFLLASVATADPAPVLGRTSVIGWQPPDLQPPVDEPEGFVPNEPAPIAPAEAIDVAEATRTTAMVLQILGFLAIAAAVVMIARSRWESRDDVTGVDDDGTAGFVTLAEVADAIVGDADAHRDALLTGPPGDAIVACWMRLEASVEAAGVARDPALTSTELTVAVLQRFPVDPDPIERLGALFREARFSHHELGELERRDALGALEAVHAGLRVVARAAPVTSTARATAS